MINMFHSNNPSSGDINSSNLTSFACYFGGGGGGWEGVNRRC